MLIDYERRLVREALYRFEGRIPQEVHQALGDAVSRIERIAA